MPDRPESTTDAEKRGLRWAGEADGESAAYYEKSWALVIGINDYGGEHATLANAVNDARQMARVLAEEYGFDHVFTLYDQEASRDEILGWLRDKLPGNVPPIEDMPKERVGPDDRVVIFFAGHGTTQRAEAGHGRGFIIPQDARRGRYGDYVDMSELREACGYIDAKHILILLDCCFSGVAAVSARTELAPSPHTLTDAFLERITQCKAWQIMTAGDQDDLAADSSDRPGHSAFTSALLAGLEGLADHNQDKLITATDLANYVKPEVTRQTARSGSQGQAPFFNYLAGSDQGDFVFVRTGDKPIIRPADLIEAEVKPFLQQYPWVLPVAGIVLVALVILGWLAASRRGGLGEEEVATRVAAQLATVYAEQTRTARDRATADAAEAATGTAVAFAPAATQTAAATQALATAVAISSREADLELEVQSLSVQAAFTPTLTATPTPTNTATLRRPTATPTPRLQLLDDFEGEDKFEVHQYSGNPATATVDAGTLVFDFEIKPDQEHYVGLEWRQPAQDWSSATAICACMDNDLSPGLGVFIEVGESDNYKARKPIINPIDGDPLARPCPTNPELGAYCADFDGDWEAKERLGDRSNIGYFSVFAEAYPVAPERSGSGTLRIEDIYLLSEAVSLPTPTRVPSNTPIPTPKPSPTNTPQGLLGIHPGDVTGDINIAGSSTMYELSEEMVQQFKTEGYTGNINYVAAGTDAGLEQFCAPDSQIDIAAASHDMYEDQLLTCRNSGREPIRFQVAVATPQDGNEFPQIFYTTADTLKEEPQVAAFIDFYLSHVNEVIPKFGGAYTPADESTLIESKQRLLDAVQ